MNQGKLAFSQLMAFLPLSSFRRCVASHRGNHKVQDFTCMDQFLTMFETAPINQLPTPPEPDKYPEIEPQQLSPLKNVGIQTALRVWRVASAKSALSAALHARAKLAVSSDSGRCHMAVSLGVSTLFWFNFSLSQLLPPGRFLLSGADICRGVSQPAAAPS